MMPKKRTHSCYHCKNVTRNIDGKIVCRLGHTVKSAWKVNRCKDFVFRADDV